MLVTYYDELNCHRGLLDDNNYCRSFVAIFYIFVQTCLKHVSKQFPIEATYSCCCCVFQERTPFIPESVLRKRQRGAATKSTRKLVRPTEQMRTPGGL